MKNYHFQTYILVATLMFQSVSLVQAKEKSAKRTTRVEESPIVYHRDEPMRSSKGSGRYALGFSTFQSGIPTGSGIYNTTSITGIYEFDSLNMVQGFFSIPATSPFNMGGSVLLKHTLFDHGSSGFHVGAGVGAASLNGVIVNGVTAASASLALSFTAVFGFHFEVPGAPHVMVHLDGGPNFYLINSNTALGASNTNTNFTLTSLSPALGASIVYVF